MKIIALLSFCIASLHLSAQNVIINSQNKKMNVALSGNDSIKVFMLNTDPAPDVKDVFVILNMDQQDTDKWIRTFTFTTNDTVMVSMSQAAPQGIYLMLLKNLFEKLEKGKTYVLNCETKLRDSTKGEKTKPQKTPICKIEVQ